jgi:hypothetical protein
MRKTTVGVSVRAVEARIKKRFEKEGVFFVKARRGSSSFQEAGAYFIHDAHHAILAAWPDIQRAAVETEILEPWEQIEYR